MAQCCGTGVFGVCGSLSTAAWEGRWSTKGRRVSAVATWQLQKRKERCQNEMFGWIIRRGAAGGGRICACLPETKKEVTTVCDDGGAETDADVAMASCDGALLLKEKQAQTKSADKRGNARHSRRRFAAMAVVLTAMMAQDGRNEAAAAVAAPEAIAISSSPSDSEKDVADETIIMKTGSPAVGAAAAAAAAAVVGAAAFGLSKRTESTSATVNDEERAVPSPSISAIDTQRRQQDLIADKIASGDFTVTSSAVIHVLEYLRKQIAILGPLGLPISKMLLMGERKWKAILRAKIPEARGDIRAIIGQPFFVPLFSLYLVYGGVFRLSFGPKSFVVVSDPAVVKSILRDNAKNYSKGLLSEILDFVMGQGLIPADGEVWRTRRRAIAPAIHRKYVEAMINLFGRCSDKLCLKLDEAARQGEDVEMESLFSRLTLDVIGMAVFNYEFDALNMNSGVIEAVYLTLREAESRSTALFPYWKIAPLRAIIPRQRRISEALKIINSTLDELILKCKRVIEEEDEEFFEEYINKEDPSILHFLLASGDQVNSKQLRDDLMTLLIAGHETGAAVLTWTFYLLAQHPEVEARLQAEVDEVVGDRVPALEDIRKLKYTSRVINESMRLYPQPPVLIRRALEDTHLGGYKIKEGTDIFISVWNLHHSPKIWDRSDDFWPERWPLDGPDPNEVTEDFRYLPFGGGQRKCIGDQFATFEMIVAIAMLVRRFNFRLSPKAPEVAMTTGATIHTKEGLLMTVTRRAPSVVPASLRAGVPLSVA